MKYVIRRTRMKTPGGEKGRWWEQTKQRLKRKQRWKPKVPKLLGLLPKCPKHLALQSNLYRVQESLPMYLLHTR